ncbi:MAG: phosphoribosylformylglycinamidine synthase subunit PurL [Firmicutes bacterium]|nr:phosphoribosylformylglycinamidine synthase subunit PurL [Bacillota bacterium]
MSESTDNSVLSETMVAQAHALHLSDHELQRLIRELQRLPNPVELRLFGALWSEHCSYKHSRPFLRRFPTKGTAVVQGPGENAGILDLGQGMGLAMKVESHNHPSAIDPVQGAATGVGGILRDILAMGARPVALLDGLFFGPSDLPADRFLAEGIVTGVSSYGNAVGVPTVSGLTRIDAGYRGQPLVNAMAVGLVPLQRIVFGRAQRPGNLLVLIGATTCRDGVGGAAFASEKLRSDAAADRPAVQVGDPFAEKRLIEAILEAVEAGWLVSCQDMGAAGLLSSSAELCHKGGWGCRLELDHVPLRQQGLAAWEILLSESQERMLVEISKDIYPRLEALGERYQLQVAVVGEVTEAPRYVVYHHGECVADLPVGLLCEAPEVPVVSLSQESYLLPQKGPLHPVSLAPISESAEIEKLLLCLLAHPRFRQKAAIYERYDSGVGGRTARGPGAGAAVLLTEEADEEVRSAFALTMTANPRYAARDPYRGAALTVIEAVERLAAVGATPLGVTDCLNLGDPETPQGAVALDRTTAGAADACRMLGLPVVSGNVSLYNESALGAIPPTLVIGAAGRIDAWQPRSQEGCWQRGDRLWVAGSLAGSWSGSMAEALLETPPEEIDLPFLDVDYVLRTCAFVRTAWQAQLLSFAEPLWEGGLLVALAQETVESSLGVQVVLPSLTIAQAGAVLFGEGAGRFLLAAPAEVSAALTVQAQADGIQLTAIGTVGEEQEPQLTVATGEMGRLKWPRDALAKAYREGTA